MTALKQATSRIAAHEAIDWSKAPIWATHAGMDHGGWHWFDHQPYIYNATDFLKGLLARSEGGSYPKGRCENITRRRDDNVALLSYIVRPTADRLADMRDSLLEVNRQIDALKKQVSELEVKQSGLVDALAAEGLALAKRICDLKVGDKVQVLQTDPMVKAGNLKAGETYTILATDEDDDEMPIRLKSHWWPRAENIVIL